MTINPSNERYKKIIESIDQLPALPSIVSRLIQVINSPDSSADDAASLIEKDPALTSKMLRLANSAFYGMPRAVSSVSSAVVILGFNSIKSLVLSATILKMFTAQPGADGFDKRRFWIHSIGCGMGARIIIRNYMRVRMMDPESAFCAGILHDIGKLIFEQFAHDDYREVCRHAAEKKISLLQAESAVMGITHTEVGRIIADKWALPIDLECSIVCHHAPENSDKIVELISAVHLADRIAHELNRDTIEGEVPPPAWEGARSILKVDDAEYESVRKSMEEETAKTGEFFSIITR